MSLAALQSELRESSRYDAKLADLAAESFVGIAGPMLFACSAVAVAKRAGKRADEREARKKAAREERELWRAYKAASLDRICEDRQAYGFAFITPAFLIWIFVSAAMSWLFQRLLDKLWNRDEVTLAAIGGAE